MPRNIEDDLELDGPPAWMAEAEASRFIEEPREPAPPLALIDPAAWLNTEPPERSWKVKDYIPDRQATLLTGKGAAGKSLVSQQQCTCVALGLPFLGIETTQTVAIYITCEDDADELHRRQKAICDSLGVSLEDLSGKLFLLSLQGEMNNELATFDREGRMFIGPRYEQIVAACEASGAGFVVLDNTAHTYSGNENDRHQVAGFINLCNRLALHINGAVVIVGHPNKAGDSYSGSTAWENQVRSRLFMEIPVNDEGVATDPDARVMRREKSNYAQRGGDLNFIWFKGAFVLPESIPEESRFNVDGIAQASLENDLFLRCLAKAAVTKRAVSHVNGINYAPRIFAHMPEAKGAGESAFRGAMERLISLGKIELDAPLWRGPNRVMKHGIIATNTQNNLHEPPLENGGKPCTNPARTPCTDPHKPHSQVIENIAPTLHCTNPYIDKSIYPAGAAGALPAGGDWESNPLLRPLSEVKRDTPEWIDEAPPIGEDDTYFDFDRGDDHAP
ncbi:AAA family ATPase [Rhizorhapis suberifaciens]|uniref:RecA-family ATPase n=1 Tax=Rhizorhapis suberifaciens TaxID=13656 RepID=A0A840HY91_9SPHN|nr:AAA family ATPase [Rhizorhapis suberifaciens]MBB4642354.1 RecA-family ATPase [Rhizorhapis suberifaciens]